MIMAQPKVTVNGIEIRASGVTVVLQRGMDSKAEAAAEILVRDLTGRDPASWVDGAGATVIVASEAPAYPQPESAYLAAQERARYAVRGHYHDATGHEDTLCQCPEPGRYAPAPCDPEESG